MKLTLKQHIYFFSYSNCVFFIVLVLSILWSINVAEVALKHERYAHKIEAHTSSLKQLISQDDFYAQDYNSEQWFSLAKRFTALLRQVPQLSPRQQTIQKSISSQNNSILRLFAAISKSKSNQTANHIKEHLRLRLITLVEAIRADAMQLSHLTEQDTARKIRQQIGFIICLLAISLFMLIFGASKLVSLIQQTHKELKNAFIDNSTGQFQKVELTNHFAEFDSIADDFNNMNKALSESTVSLASMKEIVAERTQVLEQLSNTDALTQVANRRSLFERGHLEFSRVKRTQSSLTLMLIDCDYFKDVNDQYGHLFGDDVLKHLCKLCKAEIRDIDFFARYGGEEFIMLLPESDLGGAVKTAKRIQRALAENPLFFENQPVPITVSIGISSTAPHHTSFEQLIKDADKAMYNAKNNGRNRIETFS